MNKAYFLAPKQGDGQNNLESLFDWRLFKLFYPLFLSVETTPYLLKPFKIKDSLCQNNIKTVLKNFIAPNQEVGSK